jgi:hypothetical protein
LGLGVLAGAAALCAVLLPSSCGIEGAYFDPSTDAPAAAGSVAATGPCWAPDVLLGAAGAFAISAGALALLAWRVRRR